jgi:hypothetical protein
MPLARLPTHLDVDGIRIPGPPRSVKFVEIETEKRQLALSEAWLVKNAAEKGFHKNELSIEKATDSPIDG